MLLTQVSSVVPAWIARTRAMEGNLHSPPCVLDTGIPCRYDGCVNSIVVSRGLGRRWLTIGTGGWQARIDKLTGVSGWPVWTHIWHS